MPLSDHLPEIFMLFLLVLSVVTAARFIKHLSAEVGKNLLLIITIPVMLAYAGLTFVLGMFFSALGLNNENLQLVLTSILLAGMALFVDRKAKRIYGKS